MIASAWDDELLAFGSLVYMRPTWCGYPHYVARCPSDDLELYSYLQYDKSRVVIA